MKAPSPPRPLRRLSPGTWLLVIWCASTTYAVAVPVGWSLPAFFLLRRSPMVPIELLLSMLLVLRAGDPRRPPPRAFALVLASSFLVTGAVPSDANDFPPFLPVDVALCFLAATHPRRVSVRALAMAIGLQAGYSAMRILMGWSLNSSVELIVLLTVVVSWLVGDSIRQSREHAETVRARAAVDERLRLARELHDMVAHSIGIIAIQAGMGSRVMGTQPQEARNALTAIESTSRETLAGLRRMMGVLRQGAGPDGAGPPAEPAPLAPAPVPADLDRLVAATRDAGVLVELRRLGTPRELPAEIELSAYRIVQESLTNVVRHAAAARCRVTVDYRDDRLAVEITDDGSGHATCRGGSGYGIAGMRERVGLLHGEFTAGPLPDGGFRVAAHLPVPAAERAVAR